MQRADGRCVRVRLSVKPLQDEEGHVLASWSMIQDIGAPQWVDDEPLRQLNDAANPVPTLPDSSGSNGKHPERVLVKSAGRAYFLSLNEIDWFGAAGNYVELHAGSRSYLLRRTMNKLESSLDHLRFLRIHRATIVNAQRIKELRARRWGDYDVILQDNARLRLSRSYRKHLRRFLG